MPGTLQSSEIAFVGYHVEGRREVADCRDVPIRYRIAGAVYYVSFSMRRVVVHSYLRPAGQLDRCRSQEQKDRVSNHIAAVYAGSFSKRRLDCQALFNSN